MICDALLDLCSAGINETFLLCVGITAGIRGNVSGEGFEGREVAHWRLPQPLPSGIDHLEMRSRCHVSA